MTIENPPADPLDRCYIGSCHRHGQCMYQPCRAPAVKPEHPVFGISVLVALIVTALGGYLWL